LLSLLSVYGSCLNDFDVDAPNKRYSSIINVENTIRISKVVLAQNDVLIIFTQQTYENADTIHWNIYPTIPTAQTFAYTGVKTSRL
jgi:hypothetical protein